MGVLKNKVIYLTFALAVIGARSGAVLGATPASANQTDRAWVKVSPPSTEPRLSPSDKSAAQKCLQIVAEDTHYDMDKGIIVCEGSALAVIDGQDAKMEADTIIYNKNSEMIEGRGHVRIIRKGEVTTGSAFKFRIADDGYLITVSDTEVNQVSIVSRAKIGADKYLRFWHQTNPAVFPFLTMGASASKFVPLSKDATLPLTTTLGPFLGGTPKFAQYRLGGFFGNGVRGYRVNRVINNNLKVTSWFDYGQVMGNNNMNSILNRNALGASVDRGHGDYGLPIIRTVSPSERRGLNVGDFPKRGIKWRCGKAVSEQPYIQIFSKGLDSPMNGELPWLF